MVLVVVVGGGGGWWWWVVVVVGGVVVVAGGVSKVFFGFDVFCSRLFVFWDGFQNLLTFCLIGVSVSVCVC